MSGDNVISFMDNAEGARQRIADAKLNALVTQLRGLVSGVLPRLLGDLFENLDDDLFALADKSDRDLLQTHYFDAMRELRKLRHPIEDGVLRTVLKRFDTFWSGESADRLSMSGLDSEDLALITDEDLEENLAVTTVVTKAENQYHRALYALGQRFGHLSGVGEVSPVDNPLGPKALVEAFHRGMSQWQGKLPVKLIIFKLFERHVMGYVGGLYDEMNDVLVSAGVLPKIVQQVKRNPVAPSVQRARGESDKQAAEAAAGAVRESEGELTANLLSVIADLLANRRASTGHEPRLLLLPVVPSGELVNALNNLQHHALGESASSLDEAREARQAFMLALFQALELGSGEHQVKRLEQPDQDVLDVVSMLFDFILDDPNLPDPMKVLLSRLQIPMVKVAMMDKSFFSKKTHPARRLLNNLAHAVVGWVDDGDRTAQSLYGRVECIVTRVLTDFVDDMALFEELDANFTAYLEREARGAQVAEERMTQVTRGQEHLKVARKRVEQVIKDCLGDMEGLPEPAANLLNEPWRDVLLLAYLREGEESETWRAAVKVAHELVWSVSPKIAQDERQELLKTIPELLRKMREGLANISYDQHKAAVLFKDLQACHIAALRGKATACEQLFRPVLHEADNEPRPEALQDEYHRLAAGMEIGQWLEWEQGERKLRGKLSWKSELTGSYVFVNRKGLKNAEMSQEELAGMLRQGQARILADAGSPLMERALAAMLGALKGAAPGPLPNPA